MEHFVKPLLRPYVAMAELLAETLGEDCEVVLHDLSIPEHSVVYVANGCVTGRKVGENFEHLVRQVILSEQRRDDYVANYYFKAGKKLVRSSTLLIREAEGKLAGALCINLDTTRVAEQIRYLQRFLPPPPAPRAAKQADAREAPPSDEIAAMVMSLIENIIGDKPVHLLERSERIEKIRFMEQKGIFNVKGSVEQVAAKLGINKVTVYSYLDEIKRKRG